MFLLCHACAHDEHKMTEKENGTSVFVLFLATIVTTGLGILVTTGLAIGLLNNCFLSDQFDVVGCKAAEEFYDVAQLSSDGVSSLPFDHGQLPQIPASLEKGEFTVYTAESDGETGGRIAAFWNTSSIDALDQSLCPDAGGPNVIAFRINHITLPAGNGNIEVEPTFYDDDGVALDQSTYSGLTVGGTYGDYKYGYSGDFE